MSYEIRNGKIESGVCELIVAHHCNASCRSCDHLASRAKQLFVDPDSLAKDLSALARYYRPSFISLLGGEPLLHPRLLDVLDVIRQSAISERIRVVTNGALLGSVPDRFWQSVDQVCISVYPDFGPRPEEIRRYLRQAKEHGVHLELRWTDSFLESYSELGTTDADLIARVYHTCKVVHVWRCHTLCDGYLYRCPRSMCIPRHLLGRSGPEAVRDGFPVAEGETSRQGLLEFLSAEAPLESCRYCLGTAGKRFAHEQESRGARRPPRTTEDLVDWQHLERLEKSGSLDVPLWLRGARYLAGKALALMPAAVRLHPAVVRAVAASRRIEWPLW